MKNCSINFYACNFVAGVCTNLEGCCFTASVGSSQACDCSVFDRVVNMVGGKSNFHNRATLVEFLSTIVVTQGTLDNYLCTLNQIGGVGHSAAISFHGFGRCNAIYQVADGDIELIVAIF